MRNEPGLLDLSRWGAVTHTVPGDYPNSAPGGCLPGPGVNYCSWMRYQLYKYEESSSLPNTAHFENQFAAFAQGETDCESKTEGATFETPRLLFSNIKGLSYD